MICSDPEEHRRRVEERTPDIPRHTLPTWRDVITRDYRPWSGTRLQIDTARTTVADAVRFIRAALRAI
jgi:hypothetical protein